MLIQDIVNLVSGMQRGVDLDGWVVMTERWVVVAMFGSSGARFNRHVGFRNDGIARSKGLGDVGMRRVIRNILRSVVRNSTTCIAAKW